MYANETELAMVRRHVEEGAGHVAKQHALIVRLLEAGLPIQGAEALLVALEDSQRQHEDHLARIMPEQE